MVSKGKRGLGIKNLKGPKPKLIDNLAMEIDEHSLWKEVVLEKYGREGRLSTKSVMVHMKLVCGKQ